MNKRATQEIALAVLLIAVFVSSLIPSLAYARRERRDGQRRNELAGLKISLERYYNRHNEYPLELPDTSYQYIVTEQADGQALAWYLRTPLENALPEAASFDFDEGRNYYFRIIRSNGTTYYDICGGSSTCGAPPRE